MGMREKLIELLITAKDLLTLSRQADFLIANDVVPVVRCKDCKHWDVDPDTYGDALGPEGCCFGICDGANTTKHDDFCSCGERKNNE